MIGLAVCNEGSDADDRVIDVLWKFVAERLADFRVGFADKIIGGRRLTSSTRQDSNVLRARSFRLPDPRPPIFIRNPLQIAALQRWTARYSWNGRISLR